jgi:hypothetical protein
MSPHFSAIFLQHSRSAGVIAALGTTHAITGSAANNTARAKTATLVHSFNTPVYLQLTIRRNKAAKVSAYHPARESFKLGPLRRNAFNANSMDISRR